MDPFIGEIRMFAGTFAPRDWLLCQGQTLAINDFQALYAILGTTYGGDGRTTFKLPDLRGRVPIGARTGIGLTPRYLGSYSGYEQIVLSEGQMPAHVHDISNSAQAVNNLSVLGSGTIKCSGNSGNSQDPTDAFPAKTKAVGGDKIYTTDSSQATASMNANAIELNTSIQGDIQVNVTSQCHATGGGIAHYNMQPWLCLNFIIATDGVFPPRP